jgi:WD40 repeat protein
MATGGKDSLIELWNIADTNVKFETTLRSKSAVKSLVFSNDGTLLYSLQEDGKVLVWNIKSQTSSTLNLPASKPISFALNRTNNTLVLGMTNGTLYAENIGSGKGTVINAHSAQVDNIVFNSDYSLMATAGSDRTIEIFSAASLETLPPVAIKDIHFKARNMIFASSGKLVVATDDNIYLIETSEEKMADALEAVMKRNLSADEWNKFFKDIPYQKTVNNLPAGN